MEFNEIVPNLQIVSKATSDDFHALVMGLHDSKYVVTAIGQGIIIYKNIYKI